MNYRKLRKAKRVGAFLKIATRMLKYDRWNDGYMSYCVNGCHTFCRRDFIKVIEKNKIMLKELLS